jgi:FkbM family methyltransferase
MKSDYEPLIEGTFADFFRDHEAISFWDIGANIGFYSFLAKSLCPDVYVEAFQPDPRNVSLARTTIGKAGLEAIKIHEFALGDEIGTARFTFDDVSGFTGSLSGRYSLAQTSYGGGRSESVQVSTIDTVRSESSRKISLIKIDVEGHEVKVLRGGLETLEVDRPVIVFECVKDNYADATALLRHIGYQVRVVDDNHLLATPAKR